MVSRWGKSGHQLAESQQKWAAIGPNTRRMMVETIGTTTKRERVCGQIQPREANWLAPANMHQCCSGTGKLILKYRISSNLGFGRLASPSYFTTLVRKSSVIRIDGCE